MPIDSLTNTWFHRGAVRSTFMSSHIFKYISIDMMQFVYIILLSVCLIHKSLNLTVGVLRHCMWNGAVKLYDCIYSKNVWNSSWPEAFWEKKLIVCLFQREGADPLTKHLSLFSGYKVNEMAAVLRRLSSPYFSKWNICSKCSKVCGELSSIILLN